MDFHLFFALELHSNNPSFVPGGGGDKISQGKKFFYQPRPRMNSLAIYGTGKEIFVSVWDRYLAEVGVPLMSSANR
jgi:hypothetical protein